MTDAPADGPTQRKPPRLWPGIVAAVLLLFVRFGVPLVLPGFEGFRIALFGGFLCVLAILVWWVFFSRAPPAERWGAVLLAIVALVVTLHFNHESMGLMWCVAYGVPVLSLAFVAWTVTTRRLGAGPRRAALIGTLVLASGAWTLVRSDGMTGAHSAEFAWRWSETREQRLLAQASHATADYDEPTRLSPLPPSNEGAGWPGFRGPGRDGVIRGVTIETDWSRSPPVELWRRPVGPGWSSFAVQDNRLYTQEQRGEDEVVSCHDATTGEPLWLHRDVARFYESMGGAGPRATPTLGDGRVYALGATGILNALDAVDGKLAWSRDVAADTGARVPIWGFASSPLLIDDLVVVAALGQLAGYDQATGTPRWSGPAGGESYSSPHSVTIDGVRQILLLDEAGATSVAPRDGALLWQTAWQGQALVQPALTADGDVLISAGEGHGVRRLSIAHEPDGWSVEERWTSNRLKPNFNDFVVHGGHAYGFDGRMLACIDVDDGERRWKGGRYGHGQLVLLAEQGVLLLVSERGDLALVAASPERFTELARFAAINGKTWNHPVLVGNLLLVRNGQEMAAFRLSPA